MTHDYITPAERLSPRSRWMDFFGIVWLKYQYRIACWEIDKQARHAAEWRWVQLQCQDKLKQLGIDPNEKPENITHLFELWVLAGILAGLGLIAVLFSAYREALLQLIQEAM